MAELQWCTCPAVWWGVTPPPPCPAHAEWWTPPPYFSPPLTRTPLTPEEVEQIAEAVARRLKGNP